MINRKTVFDIKIDFKKSHGSYLFDKNSQVEFLDFFGFFSSLPLGYNHRIFKEKEFIDTISRISNIKVANNAIETDERVQFLEKFSKYAGMDFKYFHFCCTGALAVESALKVAIDYKKSKRPMVISFKGSFHGINCWGLATDRFFPIDLRLETCPEVNWPKVNNIDEIKKFIEKNGNRNVAAILVEPIQCTFGDRYFPLDFFAQLRKLSDENNIPLIFDEIQTGFGVSGRMWYYQHLNIEPDILIFGKKSQAAGIMAKEKFGNIFKSPARKLKVTFDGELIDMVRCMYILEAYEKYNILNNVQERSAELVAGLKEINQLKNVRACGLLIAFDFEAQKQRDAFFDRMIDKRFMCNKTVSKTIRLRPNLNLSSNEVQEALERIKSAFN